MPLYEVVLKKQQALVIEAENEEEVREQIAGMEENGDLAQTWAEQEPDISIEQIEQEN